MSDPKEPTIRISSCRGDGRCPECGEGSAFPFRLLCGCSPCLSSACSLNHTRALLTEALRQLHMQELCTFDANGHADAAIKDMEALREERDAATRERDRARTVAELHEGDFVAAKYEFGVALTKERERADRAEALLRDVIAENVWVSAPLLAKIREVVR